MNTDRLFGVVAICLGISMLAVNIVLLAGLFDEKVDNKAIFAIIGPAYQTIVGAFVGLLSGKALSKGTTPQ